MIRRSDHSALNKFTVIRRKLAQDKNLSFQARGMLLYILSKPEGWEAQDRDIMREGGIKKHAYAAILNELKQHGYARRVEKRQTGGRFDYDLEVYEEPQVTSISPLPDYPTTVPPLPDNQVAAIYKDRARAGGPNSRLKREKEKPPIVPPEKLAPPTIDPPFASHAFTQALAEFEDHLKDNKKSLGSTRRKALYERMEIWGEADSTEALQASVLNGWTSVDPAYSKRSSATNGNGHRNGNYVDEWDAYRPKPGEEVGTEAIVLARQFAMMGDMNPEVDRVLAEHGETREMHARR